MARSAHPCTPGLESGLRCIVSDLVLHTAAEDQQRIRTRRFSTLPSLLLSANPTSCSTAWGEEKARQSLMRGWVIMASSMSNGEMISPPRLITSLERPNTTPHQEKRAVSRGLQQVGWEGRGGEGPIVDKRERGGQGQTETPGHHAKRIRKTLDHHGPVMKRYPSLSRCPMSPVLNHPPGRKASRLACSLPSYPGNRGFPRTQMLPSAPVRGSHGGGKAG
jgi:hypothetical protein